MSRLLLRLLALLLPVTLVACSERGESACPAYKAFDGVFLDYRGVNLAGNITGRICLDDDCRSLSEWKDGGGGGQGRVNLPLDEERPGVRLRVELVAGGAERTVQADEPVGLLPVYNADRKCGVYGYSRAVTLDGFGVLTFGGSTPEGR